MMEYKDLSDSAKERAYKNFQDLSDSAEEDILTETRDMLETKGIYEPVFSYSGYSAKGFLGDLGGRVGSQQRRVFTVFSER